MGARKDDEALTFTFENIFMNASDVRGDIFKLKDGQNIIDMASSNGLAIVHFNTKDSVLEASTNAFPDRNDTGILSFLSWLPSLSGFIPSFIPVPQILPPPIPRLGWRGIQGGQDVMPEDKEKVVEFDCTSDIDKTGNSFSLQQHGYIFNKFLFEKFYGKSKVEILEEKGVVKLV